MNVTILPEFAAAFALVMARIGTLVMLMPGIGDRTIPVRMRLTFALLLSLMFVPLVRPILPPLSGGIEPLAKLIILEVLIGLMIGTAVRITLMAMQLAGTLAAQQMSLSFSATVDPTAGVQNPTIATFLVLVATALIFAFDLHHLSIRGMHDSYAMMMPGGPNQCGGCVAVDLTTFTGAFKVGVQIAAQFLVFAIVFNLGLGVLSRLMPQLQIFFLAMPASIIIGTLILFAAIGVMMTVSCSTSLACSASSSSADAVADTEDKDQKTEQPTQRKLEKALEQGDVAKSQEVTSFFVLAAATLAFMISAGPAARDLTMRLRGLFGNMHQVSIDQAGLVALGWWAVTAILMALALPFLFGVAAAIAGNMIQHQPVWSLEGLMPKLSRLSPMSGLKRMFGKEALVNFIKGLLKIIIIGSLITAVLWPYRGFFESMASADVAAILPRSQGMVMKFMGGVLAVYFLLAILDFLYQRHSWIERQMMSKQEIKEEHKESEGNPEIKAKLAQIRRQMSRRRMMAAVPKASVVIMNPTHYAVALQYEPGMDAPICVAKGLDELALRIKSVALEHEVPVVENPPLARALHAAVELDGAVPEEQYKAVAEVIGYVMRLKRRAA